MTIHVTHVPSKTVHIPGNITAKDEDGKVIVIAMPKINDESAGANWEIWFGHHSTTIKTEWYHISDMARIVAALASRITGTPAEVEDRA